MTEFISDGKKYKSFSLYESFIHGTHIRKRNSNMLRQSLLGEFVSLKTQKKKKIQQIDPQLFLML